MELTSCPPIYRKLSPSAFAMSGVRQSSRRVLEPGRGRLPITLSDWCHRCDAGIKVLRLAQRAYTLRLSRPQTEKRKLLDLLLLDCTFDGTSPTASYRKLPYENPAILWQKGL